MQEQLAYSEETQKEGDCKRERLSLLLLLLLPQRVLSLSMLYTVTRARPKRRAICLYIYNPIFVWYLTYFKLKRGYCYRRLARVQFTNVCNNVLAIGYICCFFLSLSEILGRIHYYAICHIFFYERKTRIRRTVLVIILKYQVSFVMGA